MPSAPPTTRRICVRCQLRYCSQDCQQHYWRSGHQENCEIIHRGGDAEQYHAEKKYKWAVAVAVKACAEDTTGQGAISASKATRRRASCAGGFAHVSCLVRQAKILVEDAEARDLDDDKWDRWYTCGLCEQTYHGVVYCALGWACWKTYVGRPETDWARAGAMNVLGLGFFEAEHYEDALSVLEAELSMRRRLGADEDHILSVQGNLATTYLQLGRLEQALRMRQDVYSGLLRINGEEDRDSLLEAHNLASSFISLERFEEARSLMRKTIPVAQRVAGEDAEVTLRMRWRYAEALCWDTAATLDDVREAVRTLEELERTARRVFGGSHPLTVDIEGDLRNARAALRARKTPPPPGFA